MNILITGKGSYIGQRVKDYLETFSHTIVEVDTISDEWKNIDYSKYDSIVHVAAIVHSDAKTASKELFEKVNTQLPVEIARLAKNSGVKQFVFISTMAVFGTEKSLDLEKSIVGLDTLLKPVSLYGKTKLEAEMQLSEIADDNFKVAFVRPPNVYGPGCKGNYIYLFKKLANLMLVCPYAYTDIRQSMLYIDNLSEIIRLVIENYSDGVFLPQDEHTPNTVELITSIRSLYGKKTRHSRFLGSIIKLFSKVSIIRKIYGGSCYNTKSSKCFDNKYQVVKFEKGLELTYKDIL